MPTAHGGMTVAEYRKHCEDFHVQRLRNEQEAIREYPKLNDRLQQLEDRVKRLEMVSPST